MAIRIQRTKVITCDFCNEGCDPLTKRDLIANLASRAPVGRRKNLAVIDFTGFVPLQVSDPDVCNTCARLACTKLLETIPE